MEKLTFERELELSDSLVARRKVRQAAAEYQGVPESKVNFKLLNADDKQVWEDGNDAARELVLAYLQFIESTARRVAAHYQIDEDTTPSIDDVINEGVLSAFTNTWAYNLRSGGDQGKRRGKRFSAYAGRHIHRNMVRLCMKEATPYHIDINVIKATRYYHATKSALKDELQRNPTEQEIRNNLYAEKNTEVIPALPMRGQFGDVHEHVSEDGGRETPSTDIPEIVVSRDVDMFNRMMQKALYSVVDKEIARDVLLYIGADRGYPRDDPAEFAKALGITAHKARKRISNVIIALTHPSYRRKLWEAINGQQE